MTGQKEGQRMKYQKDGRIFRITKITRDFAVLQALDDSTQVLTGIFSLDFLFEKAPPDRFQGEQILPKTDPRGCFGEERKRRHSLTGL